MTTEVSPHEKLVAAQAAFRAEPSDATMATYVASAQAWYGRRAAWDVIGDEVVPWYATRFKERYPKVLARLALND